jgi:hypothetical protein
VLSVVRHEQATGTNVRHEQTTGTNKICCMSPDLRRTQSFHPNGCLGWRATLCHDGHGLPPLQTKFLRNDFFYVENRRRASKRCFRIVRHSLKRTPPIAEAFQAIRIRK